MFTHWFPGSIKPVRDGVYMRKLSRNGPLFYCRFADGIWYAGVSVGANNGRKQAAQSIYKSAQQGAKWIGLDHAPR